ncbi:MAG: hypothetical protein KBH99_08945 [Syntrophobacteraceae bacterium]|nr:hypothetical protein [Syntrophobacteraceae bacterium]
MTADWKAEGHIVRHYPKNEVLMSTFPGIESLQKGVGARLPIQRGPWNSESVRPLFTTSHNAEGGERLPGDADDLRLSEVVQQLSGSGLDLIVSSFSECSGKFTFNLGYRDQRIRGFTAGGSYETRSQSLRVDFSFEAALTVRDSSTGRERQELFEFNLHLEAVQSLGRSSSVRVQKEDILQFARRLTQMIAKIHSEGKEIDGLLLDTEDLQELGAVDEGRLLESIMALIEVLRSVQRLKKEEGQHVWVGLERGKSMVSEGLEQRTQIFRLSLEVRKVTTEGDQECIVDGRS